MSNLSRRSFLQAAISAAVASQIASAQSANPPRLARKDCYFGLHFDLHPNRDDKDLGRDLTDAMVAHLIETVRPDFIQYDSKGHPGYLGFPSKTGMSAPGIVNDSLAIWRRITAARGVALYNHFSGVLDGLALQRHPEWARVAQDGKPDSQESSLFSPYERELMIPELLEAAQNYSLDGSWVDGDCWAVQPDYCEASQREFTAKTGLATLPAKLGDPGWVEFADLQRSRFRQYVAAYVDALHSAHPGYAITSNWYYSTMAPEEPTVPVDFLSGDLADHAAIRQARLQARYLAATGKPWDLMSWGFEFGDRFSVPSTKPIVELQQEAAVILAQGGAYQVYFVPTRSGWIDDRIVRTAAQAASFCRRRQQWSHQSDTVPEVGVLFSGRTLYRRSSRIYGGWGQAEYPAVGALEMLLASGYSVDILPDWKLPRVAASYTILVLPEWKDAGPEVAATLVDYAAGGGHLLVCGAENALLFAGPLNLPISGHSAGQDLFVPGENGFAQLPGECLAFLGSHEVVAEAWRTTDTRKEPVTLAIRVAHGQGSIILCPAPLCSSYAGATTPILAEAMRRLVARFAPPRVTLQGALATIEIVLRTKSGQLLVHLINTAGAPVSGEFRDPGNPPLSGPVRVTVRLAANPSAAFLEPAGTAIRGEYKDGAWSANLPETGVHFILRFNVVT